MFILTLQDRKGNELNEGDIVKISNGKDFTFYSEVKYLEDEQCIVPFHTFSFHSFEKVDKLPNNAIQSTETRYKIWYVSAIDAEEDKTGEEFRQYLMSWRECEIALEYRCFVINKLAQ